MSFRISPLLPPTSDPRSYIVRPALDICEERKKGNTAAKGVQTAKTSNNQNSESWVSPLVTFKSASCRGNPVRKLRFHLHVQSKRNKNKHTK